MSQNLYEEAIAEARRLREMAEENAKNKIIDAVTPQIRQLIEQELMGDEEEADADVSDDAASDDGPMVVDLDSLEASPPMAPAPAAAPAESDDSAVLRVGSDGALGIEVGDVSIEVDAGGSEGEEDEILLDEPMAEALATMISKSSSGRRRLRESLTVLEKKINVLGKALSAARTQGTKKQREKVAEIFESLAREAVILRRQVILTEKDTGGRILERKLVNSIIKEMKLMSRKNNQNIFDFLFEAEEDQATLSEMEVVLSDDDLEALGVEEPGEVDVADLEVDLLMADEEEGGDEEGEEAEDDGDDEPLDLGEMEEMEEVYEIDEASLRRELSRLRKLNENDPTDGSGDSSFGDGSAEDEMFVDVDEDDLLNALADELGDAPMPDAGASSPDGGDAMAESRRRRLRRRRSAQRRGGNLSERRAQRQARDYKKVAGQLKEQLVEMNLFNAKLLYANKLMQNRDLTAKQQRAIVEALDNAKTLREAKLLYKSLTSSLNKRSSKKNLAEGRSTRSLGSASKSAQSAQPAQGAGSMDRWAILAGINQDK